MRYLALLIAFVCTCWCTLSAQDDFPRMTQHQLRDLVIAKGESVRAISNVVQFKYEEVDMILIVDPLSDRMRIIAPIMLYDSLTEDQKYAIAESNFQRALDARYATSNGILYSAFVHPLSNLDHELVTSAMSQVANLVQTFGSSYSGSGKDLGPIRTDPVTVDETALDQKNS